MATMASTSPLGKLFGRSPIAPLQQHMQLAAQAVRLLDGLRKVVAEPGSTGLDEAYGELERNSEAARALHRELREQLPRGLFLAVPRPDLLTLLDLQQRIVRNCRRSADTLYLRPTAVPEALQPGLKQLSHAMVDSAGLALSAIQKLDELIEVGFGEHERRRIRELLQQLDDREAECREAYQAWMRAIAGAEGELGAVDAVFLYRIADEINIVAKDCGNACEQLRLLLAQ